MHHEYLRQISCNTVFPRDMVCLRNISVDTLHKGDTEDDDDDDNDDDDDDDNNNNHNHNKQKFQSGLFFQVVMTFYNSELYTQSTL